MCEHFHFSSSAHFLFSVILILAISVDVNFISRCDIIFLLINAESWHVHVFLCKVFKSFAYIFQLGCLIFIINFYQILIHSEHKFFAMIMNCEHSVLWFPNHFLNHAAEVKCFD